MTSGRPRGWKSIKSWRCTSSGSWRRSSVRDRWAVQAKVRRRSDGSWHDRLGPRWRNKRRPRAIWRAKPIRKSGSQRQCRAIITTFQGPAIRMYFLFLPSPGSSSALQACSPPKRSFRSRWMLNLVYEPPNLTFNNWNYQNISPSSPKCSLDHPSPSIRSVSCRKSSHHPSSTATSKRTTTSSTFESPYSCKRPTASISSLKSTKRASNSSTRSKFAPWAPLSK